MIILKIDKVAVQKGYGRLVVFFSPNNNEEEDLFVWAIF